MEITLFEKYAESPLGWETNPNHKARTKIEYRFYFSPERLFKEPYNVFVFNCSAGNVSNSSNDPFSCIWRTLEHESIGMAKYDNLKSDARRKGLWQQL